MPKCTPDQEKSAKSGKCIKRCVDTHSRDAVTGRCKKRGPLVLSKKQLSFNKVLIDAKRALDSVGIQFHLHYGTALGAHRERKFIEHDGDIDLAVFASDVNTKERLSLLKKSMKKHGFTIDDTMGKLDRGYEMQFAKDGVDLQGRI
jgi:hypothetical protein